MLEHINHLKSLHDQLKEMGVDIDDKELAMTLLASLSDEYKALITALDVVGEDSLSFDKVKGMLLNDTDRNMDIRYIKNSEEDYSANRFQGHGRKGKQGHGSGGLVNHEMKSDKSFRGKCHFCHENGHMARDCPVKQKSKACLKGGTVRSKGSVNCSEKVQNSDPDEIINEEALVTSDQVNDFEWIIDSGATQLMTFDIDFLSDYIEFKEPCTVNLGDNGTILAYGKDTYRIVANLGDKVQHIALHDVLYLPNFTVKTINACPLTSKFLVQSSNAE